VHYEILVRYISSDGRLSHVHYYHLRLLLALKGFKMNIPFFFLQSLKKTTNKVQSTVGDPERSLFHHGLLKILVQHQLSLVGKSWDVLLAENDFGPTQYWPTLLPKSCKKCKASSNPEFDDIGKVVTKDGGLQKTIASMNIDIGSVTVIERNSLNAEDNLVPLPGCFDTSVKIDAGLKDVEKITELSSIASPEVLVDLPTSSKHYDEPVQKLEELANVCYAETNLEQKKLTSEFSRHFTRSMVSMSVPVTLLQHGEPPVIETFSEQEDQVPMEIPLQETKD
jgi:hypothetical protein